MGNGSFPDMREAILWGVIFGVLITWLVVRLAFYLAIR